MLGFRVETNVKDIGIYVNYINEVFLFEDDHIH